MKLLRWAVNNVLLVSAVVGMVVGGAVAGGMYQFVVHAQSPNTIVPGHSIGPVTVGMSITEACTLIAAIAEVEPSESGGCFNSGPGGLGLGVHPRVPVQELLSSGGYESRVWVIFTDDGSYVTVAGNHVGSPLTSFVEEFGVWDRVTRIAMFIAVAEWKNGFMLFFDPTGSKPVAEAVGVFPPVAGR